MISLIFHLITPDSIDLGISVLESCTKMLSKPNFNILSPHILTKWGHQCSYFVFKEGDLLGCTTLIYQLVENHCFIYQGLELEVNLRGIWKNHVTPLIKGVLEEYFFADLFCSFYSDVQIWFNFYSMLQIEWVISDIRRRWLFGSQPKIVCVFLMKISCCVI